jgi:hypothetical protein
MSRTTRLPLGSTAHCAARSDQRFPEGPALQHFISGDVRREKEDFRSAAALPPSEDAGGHDACLVQDEHVTGGDQVGNVAEDAMVDAAVRMEHQEPALVAALRGVACDLFVGQLVVEGRGG